MLKMSQFMTVSNILEQLIEYGLSPQEAKVYIFLIENLESPAFKVSKGTGIPRATIYLILESLRKKGLVTISKRNNVSYYLSESIGRLKKNIQDKLNLADLLIPQLRSLAATERFSPALKLYVGKEELKNVFEDMLEVIEAKKLKQIHVISDAEILTALPKYLPEWIKKREGLGTYTYMIAESLNGRAVYETNKLRQVRLFPTDITFDCSINIYGDKIACISVNGDEVYGAIIESRTIANTMRQLFRMVWDSLEPKK